MDSCSALELFVVVHGQQAKLLATFPGFYAHNVIIGRAGVSPPSHTTSARAVYLYVCLTG